MSLKNDIFQISAEEIAKFEEGFLIDGKRWCCVWRTEAGNEPAQFRALGAFSATDAPRSSEKETGHAIVVLRKRVNGGVTTLQFGCVSTTQKLAA